MQRLCWLYTPVQNTFVYDHSGNTYFLSDFTGLSEGKTPYQALFANKPDYEQKLLLHDLQMKDVLCTMSDWINQGRYPSNLEICHMQMEKRDLFPLKASFNRNLMSADTQQGPWFSV
jgi:hypothetical protein